MRVAFLTFGDERTPSSRYRVFQYLEGLRAAGWESEIISPRKGESASRTSLRAIKGARKADLLFIQKRLFPGVCLRLLSAAAKRRLIYDFDDALFVPPSKKRSEASHRRTLGRLHRSFQVAQVVIAGNAFLAQYASKFNPWVEILPTPIDLAAHPRRPAHFQRSPQIIGWVGTSSNHRYLRLACEAICRVNEKRPVVLRVVSDRPFENALVEVENVGWEPEREALLLHEFDVGIMPLADDTWSRGKCAFKLLQYMAVGVPVVCSPVGANQEVMKDGTQGFFASSPEEWMERLCALLGDAQLRERMGSAGRERVAQRFSSQALLPHFLLILKQVAEAPDVS